MTQPPHAASESLRYLVERTRQPKGRLSDLDEQLCREDGNVYLVDVLKEIRYNACAQMIQPAQVAAIMHFLGPFPDEYPSARTTYPASHSGTSKTKNNTMIDVKLMLMNATKNLTVLRQYIIRGKSRDNFNLRTAKNDFFLN